MQDFIAQKTQFVQQVLVVATKGRNPFRTYQAFYLHQVGIYLIVLPEFPA